ncbi:protein GLUTAMINE DUMPER 2 [Mercurialis annua]|uniref:protein GLUTAMINE DUMPER 2 n=1 Tax=Mercurialis annua TaxID=3986 RepID=UPI00215EB569|nr:protein GLUTAMINE DUMPER 2 [Mercurialis annua]
MASARAPFNVTATARAVTPSAAQHSPWHSPVPYLFGGLAAMLGLIAFALLILACSYWKLSGYLENDSERDLEAGEEGKNDSNDEKKVVVFEEKILVIMAGQVKPTFLATPMSSRSSSFGDNSSTKSCSCSEKGEKSVETVKQETNDQEQQQHSESHETDQAH